MKMTRHILPIFLLMAFTLLSVSNPQNISAQTGIDALPPVIRVRGGGKGGGGSSSATFNYPTVNVTKKLLKELGLEEDDDGLSGKFRAYSISFKKAQNSLLVVSNPFPGSCGENITIYIKSSGKYKDVANLDCVQLLAPKRTLTYGFPDLVYTTGRPQISEIHISVYKFNGEKYEEKECYYKKTEKSKATRVKCSTD
jgi:hypothetical protein